MSEAFTVGFAGLSIGVESRYAFMRRFCRDYLADGEPCELREEYAVMRNESVRTMRFSDEYEYLRRSV